ncbi:MAG: AI-2E family transporter [Armatimonadota bacterium]
MTLVLVIGGVLGYLAFMHFLRDAVIIVVLAGILAYLLQPIVDYAEGYFAQRFKHAVRCTVVLVVYVLIATVFFYFGKATTKSFNSERAALHAVWTAKSTTVPDQFLRLKELYETYIPADVRAQIYESVQVEVNQFPEKLMPQIGGWVQGFAKKAGAMMAMLIEMVFVPILAYYFLTDAAKLREQLLFFVPKRRRETVVQYASGINDILRMYIRGQLILCAIAWVVVTVALMIMGIKGSLLLGVIAGVSRGIPVIGPLIGGVPVLGAVLFDQQMNHTFWWVLVGFTAMHLFEGKYLMPRILGDSLKIHPVLVVVSLLIGAQMMGLVGMFIAPPVMAIIRFLLAARRGEGPLAINPEQPVLPGTEELAASE